jgi:hypothetical protein
VSQDIGIPAAARSADVEGTPGHHCCHHRRPEPGRGGAGEGNRTLMTSLEGWGSTIELRPRARREASFAADEHRQRTGNRALRPNCGSFAMSPARRERRAAAGVCGTVGYGSAPRDVAQLGSAPALGAGGRRFESGHPDETVAHACWPSASRAVVRSIDPGVRDPRNPAIDRTAWRLGKRCDR